jgi:predicted transcriptional regulator
MSTVELKNILISKIAEINDEAFLIAINTILDSKSESVEDYNLDLKKAEKDINQGNVATHNQVLEKIAQWKKR